MKKIEETRAYRYFVFGIMVLCTFALIIVLALMVMKMRTDYLEQDFIKEDYERVSNENILLKEQVKELCQWHYLMENGTKAEIDSTIRAAKMERLGK